MKDGKEMLVQDQFLKSRRPKTREVSSRFLSSPNSTAPHDSGVPSLTKASSPMRRKHTPTFDIKRNHRSLDDSSLTKGSSVWPSSTAISIPAQPESQKIDTLADYLEDDRFKDRIDQDKNVFSTDLFLHRQRSCSRETSSNETDHRERISTKENHRPILGGSMRYTGKFSLAGRKSSPHSPMTVPGRLSVDENALHDKSSRRKSDPFLDSESEWSDVSSSCTSNISSSSRKSGVEVPSRYMNNLTTSRSKRSSSHHSNPATIDASDKLTIKGAIKKASSFTGYKSVMSQWALSPGRTGSPPMSVENKSRLLSFSSMKPPSSPSRPNGVEKLLSMGLDLFKSKKSSSNMSVSPLRNGIGESTHQIRLLHNRLMQWRTANARADLVNQKLTEQAEINLACAWESLSKLQHSVVQKRLQLEKERLAMKLYFILNSQMKPLEAWKEMEGKHSSAFSGITESLHSVVCRVPLKEGAEADPESTSFALRYASDLASATESILNPLTPSAEIVPLLMELAAVMSQEKQLMEECLEHLRIISDLEVQEWSLICSMLQQNSWQQEQPSSC